MQGKAKTHAPLIPVLVAHVVAKLGDRVGGKDDVLVDELEGGVEYRALYRVRSMGNECQFSGEGS